MQVHLRSPQLQSEEQTRLEASMHVSTKSKINPGLMEGF